MSRLLELAAELHNQANMLLAGVQPSHQVLMRVAGEIEALSATKTMRPAELAKRIEKGEAWIPAYPIRAVMQQSLEALEECRRDPRLKYEHPHYTEIITALREALAAPQPSQYGSPELQALIVARATGKDSVPQPAIRGLQDVHDAIMDDPSIADHQPLTRAETDALWDSPMPSGYGKSRYDITRAIEERCMKGPAA